MPGIVGLVTKAPREQAEQELQQMVAAVHHETFYTSGTWIDEASGVYLGWVVRENSFSSAMPVWNERKDVALVFAGEEYPEPGTAQRLKAQGHLLNGNGASYLVHLYEEDPAFPTSLNGQFHGVVVDRSRDLAMLFNDRYGMRRIYYHESKASFYFAAEAKAILAVRPELRRANLRGIGEFIACGCVLENRTLFENVFLLPGAAAWTFRRGSLERKSSYFQPEEWEQQPTLDGESFYQRLRHVFSSNLPRYFNGHEPIALALTGGLDTRAIMAWHRGKCRSAPCYTFGSMFRDIEDVRIARRVTDRCGQPYQVIEIGSDFLSRFAQYAERSVYLTDGCVEVTRASDLYVSEKARGVAPVKIVGTYGSEILRLVPTFKPRRPLDGLFSGPFVESARQAEATYGELRRHHPLTFAVFRQAPWSHYGVLALEESQLTVRSPYLDNDFTQTVYLAPQGPGATRDVRLRLISDGNPALASIRTDRGLAGNRSRLSATVVRMLLEFTYKAEYAYDYGMPNWLAQMDQQLALFRLERLFLGRHKMLHFRVWYRDALSRYVRDMLLDARTLSRPYLVPKAVEALVRDHLSGRRNYTNEIHKLLTLELLQRLFFDSR
jgi:asparagine synthase (glutamine-hydrolysing)